MYCVTSLHHIYRSMKEKDYPFFEKILILICKTYFNRKEKSFMNTAQPIRDLQELENLKNYYKDVCPHPRNYLLITMGLNTALRISDELSLKWEDVYNFEAHNFKEHINLIERKTGKINQIYINEQIRNALESYLTEFEEIKPKEALFVSRCSKNEQISRVQAFRIVKKAADYAHIEGVISCHSLRKTFGYHAWKQGISPVLLMNIFNHSSFDITKRYLGIEQDDKDQVYRSICL